MRRQHLQDAVENFDFHLSLTGECAKLSSRILSGEYAPRPAQRILLEKSKGLCRQIVLPTAVDALVLQCLSDAFYDEIKGKAPTSKSFFEPQDHTFSKFPNDGYGTFASWMNFQRELFRFSQTRPYIIVTDIANYYDSISYEHLRNTISGISGAEECVLDMLLYVLSELLWQPDYMPRIEVGLPQIDLDAPRLLAHCFLYELDEYLASTPTGDFARFMDDIDVGVNSLGEAKRVLKDIDLVLQTRQVRLNSGKTQILSNAEAVQHFRIVENAEVDAIEDDIRAKLAAGVDLSDCRKEITTRVRRGLTRGEFDDGNGEKILKRLFGLARLSDARLNLIDIYKILVLRPSMRRPAFTYIARQPLTAARGEMLAKFVGSGMLVDHGSYVDLANSLVETAAPARAGLQLQINNIVNSIEVDGYYGFYGAAWILSKYGTADQLYQLLQTKRDIWIGDHRLGRLVGGLAPIFRNSAYEIAYVAMVNRSRNDGVREAYKFHNALRQDIATYNAMYAFLAAPNASKATGITHAKFLCFLSALSNEGAPAPRQAKLLKANSLAWNDIYYRALARRAAGVKKFP